MLRLRALVRYCEGRKKMKAAALLKAGRDGMGWIWMGPRYFRRSGLVAVGGWTRLDEGGVVFKRMEMQSAGEGPSGSLQGCLIR